MRNGKPVPSKKVAYLMIAKVSITPTRYFLGKQKDFVCFSVKPADTRERGVPEFRIYDHRIETIKAAKLPVPSSGDLYRIEGMQGAAARRERLRRKSVIEVANGAPARVVVVEKRDPVTGRVSSFINLYHAEGESPAGLLSVYSYAKRRDSGCIERNRSFWSKILTQPLRHKAGAVLISLTNEENRIIMTGPTPCEVTIIGRSVRIERIGRLSSATDGTDGMMSVESQMP